MSKRNESIGQVECPHKGCTEQCSVFRFRERGETEKSIANRRFAGRLYGRCPTHGRFGGDPGEQATQEYILANAKMHGPGAAGERQPTPAKPPAAPSKSQSQNARPPARSPANAPARAPARVSNGGWNWPWE